jgi:ferric-dicitrate binding protein FerR (iron transport regulator)
MPPQTPLFDIDRMIAEEDDPKMRVLLMLVSTFNKNLTENTLAVESLGIKFDTHLTTFEARSARDDETRSQVKGAWKVLAWVLGVVQCIGLAIWIEAKSDIKEIHSAIAEGRAAKIEMDARIKALEGKK